MPDSSTDITEVGTEPLTTDGTTFHEGIFCRGTYGAAYSVRIL